MAFFRLVLYASKLNRINDKLTAEKSAGAAITRKEKPKYGCRLKLSHLWINCKRRLNYCLINLYFLRNTAFDRSIFRLRKYGSFENYVLKSIIGFICGYVLTYLLFLFLAIQLNVKLSVATVICCVIGCILTIGLAFSQNIRCIVLLTLPQFFSKRGRQALIAYALILTMTGPAKNTLNNTGIMSESLACGQEQLKSAMKQILDVIKKPFLAIKEALKAVVKAVKEVIKKIKEILLKIKRVIMAILGVIKSVYQFLGRVLNLCNKELGTPYQRCSRVFETAIADCQASLGVFFSWACSIGYLLDTVCYLVKPFDLICLLVDFLSNSIIGVVMRKIKIFIRHVKTMFYVKIKFSHSYHFESKSSKSMKEIANSIVGEVKTRTKGIASVLAFFNCAASLFLIFLVSKVVYYRHSFLTKERFDNKYLTSNLVDIDLRRAAMDKETIFPLNHRERKKYVTIKSMRLLPKERKELAESLGFLISTSLKIGTHMAIDYSLFWMMNLIRKYGKFQSKVQAPNMPTPHIAGEGFLADLLRAVVRSFQPIGISLEIDTVHCLPIPIPPDFDRYIQIASILLVCLLLTLLEPYGLRWRNWILCYYYPRRAKERAVWLYNHILRSRASFLKFARRQLRRKVLGSNKVTKVTCLEYLRSRTNNKCLLLFLGSDKQEACLLCGEVFRKSDKEDPIKCQRPGCTAIYCKQCFEDLENICTVCLSPIEYGDMSDFSEERDSSDEDYPLPPKPNQDTDGFDSGMTSDLPTEEDEGSTDDYSYGYQDMEKLPVDMTSYATKKIEDIDKEKQNSPDYVSMQYFDEEIELYSLKTFDDKDKETQFPEESFSIELDKESVSQRTFDSSSVASIFKEQMLGLYSGEESLESCHCLEINEIEKSPSKLVLEELKLKPIDVGWKDAGNSSQRKNNELETISELTEDDALIQFSTDEDEEEKNTVDRIDQKSFISPGQFDQPSAYTVITTDQFLSDSEFSENDVKKLIGTNTKGNQPHIQETLTPPSESMTDRTTSEYKSDLRDVSESSRNTSSRETIVEGLSDGGSSIDSLIESMLKRENSKKHEVPTASDNMKEESQSHIEFIGIQPKRGRKQSKTSESPSEDEEPPTRKKTTNNKSTVSTKVSKQDVPIHLKDRKHDVPTPSDNMKQESQRHIEFIGIQPKRGRKQSKTSESSSEDEKTPTGKRITNYKSTVSTKTSKQDVPNHLKDRKSILKDATESSIFTEIEQIQGREAVPRLNLKSLEKSGSDLSTSNSSETHSSYSSPRVTNKIDSDKYGKFRKTNKTEKRLKGGGIVIPISPFHIEKFSREKSDVEKAPSDGNPGSLESSSPHYPFTSISNGSTSHTEEKFSIKKPDLKHFESSDTSFSPIVLERNSSKIGSIFDDIETENSSTANAMASDLSTPPQSVDPSHSVTKSAKKSDGMSEESGDTEEATDEEQHGETDASSDISISVQENILGIPRSKLKKKQKTDLKREREIRSTIAEEHILEDTLENKTNKHAVDETLGPKNDTADSNSKSRKGMREKNSKTTTTSQEVDSAENTLIRDQNSSIQKLDPSIQEQGSATDNSSYIGKKMESSEKFTMSEESSKIMESRNSRGCKCCKCLEKLPVVHHSPGVDPNRRILLQTGVDSSTQTSIDRSERSLQIGDKRESTTNLNSTGIIKPRFRVKCKLKAEDDGYTASERPEKHCACSTCCKRRDIEHHPADKQGFYENPYIRREKEETTSRKQSSIPRKKTTGTICKPRTRNQICSTNESYRKGEEICMRCRDKCSSRQDSTDSVSSKEDSYRERLELPFQDNDEYKRLVRELEEKLVARNRERVRKTMKEFEECSRKNQNLRRPILYEDSSCCEEPILTKLVNLRAGDDELSTTDRRRFHSPKRRSAVKDVDVIKTIPGDSDRREYRLPPRNSNYYFERDSMHWRMDNHTGEWYRVSDVKIFDTYDSFELDPRYPEPSPRSNRRMMERYELGDICTDCDDLNRRYGHRYNILTCPRHRMDRFPPRHRRR